MSVYELILNNTAIGIAVGTRQIHFLNELYFCSQLNYPARNMFTLMIHIIRANCGQYVCL